MKAEEPKTNKIIHALTAAQQRYCRELVGQLNQIDSTLRGFLNYVVLENDLPKAFRDTVFHLIWPACKATFRNQLRSSSSTAPGRTACQPFPMYSHDN